MNDPRIIVYDLETLPNLEEAMHVWPQLSNYPGQTLRGQVQSVICFGWKVLGSKEWEVRCAWSYSGWKDDVNDDRELVMYAREILSGADAIISQNGRRFDLPVLQTRLLKWGIEPIDPKILHIDTKTASKGKLSFISNSLNNMGRFLLDELKMENGGWNLWCRVRQRDEEAMKLMHDYCAQDVLLLEKLYRKLRPYLTQIPNHNLFSPLKEKSCPRCGSSRLRSEGRRHTSTRSYRRYCCQDCRSWCHTDLKDEVPR